MKYVNLDQRSEAWLQWRKEGITATAACAVCGYSPWTTPWRVWAEMTGRVMPPDLSGNPQVQFGIEHEDDARMLFMQKTGEVIMPACGQWDSNPVFRASFDGLNSNGEPVEFKCPGETTLEEVRTLGRESDAYKQYIWQVQWQIMVADAQRGWLVFLDGGKVIDFEIARNDNMIREMQLKCRSFWEKNILADSPPEKLADRDVYVPVSVDDQRAWAKAADRYRSTKLEIDRLTALLEEPKEELMRLMGKYNNADFYGVSICRYQQKGPVDYKEVFARRGLVLTSEEVEQCRRETKEVAKVTLSKGKLPDDYVPEANEDLVEAVEVISDDHVNFCW